MQADSEPQTAKIVAAASALLGRPLTEPVELSEGREGAAVLRCRDAAAGDSRVGESASEDAVGGGTRAGGTVVVKTYPQTAEGVSCFAAEAAGLDVAGSSALAPALLAADPGLQLVVMSDLGGGRSLADVLLTGSSPEARTALLDWADACGRLSAVTNAHRSEFDRLTARYLAGRPDERHLAGLPGRVLAAAENAAKMGVPAPDGLAGELAEVAAAAAADQYAVFSPGDICPDNNLLTTAGVRFIDFEEAGFHPAFLDAAYITMPFSTCWCVFRFPPGLSAEAEAAYREQVSSVWPELADDAVWQPGMRRALAAWTMSATSWLLRRSLAADVPMNSEQPSPRTRQLMRYRWQSLLAELEPGGDLPAIAALVRSLLAATAGWHAPELPLYPAF
ncbi:MAG TPA: phosphotransferase [Streptosporangiaceae bacterium]